MGEAGADVSSQGRKNLVFAYQSLAFINLPPFGVLDLDPKEGEVSELHFL